MNPVVIRKDVREVKVGERFRLSPIAPTLEVVSLRASHIKWCGNLPPAPAVEILYKHIGREGVRYLVIAEGDQLATIIL
jgi:hypothetical protein